MTLLWLTPSFLFYFNRATLDNLALEVHLAWMVIMELKELLDFQALMATLGFLDHLYVARSLHINLNGIVFL